MFIISKLFTFLFLPPGIFIILFILAAITAKRFKTLFLTSAFFLWFISTQIGSNLLIKPLEKITYKDNISPKAIVILGGGVNKNDIIKASCDAFKREMYAILLAKKYNLPLIFTGGGKINEANEVKKDIKLISQICKCNIKAYYEDKSLNTYQNAKYTSKLFNKLSLKKEIFLVTSAYHMKRAIILFKHFGFKIIPKPIGYLYNPNYDMFSIFPSAHNFYKSYKAIHEYFGILSLYIRKIKI